MFKLNPNPTFVREVELTIPGELQPGKVNFTFWHKSREELDEWVKKPLAAQEAGTPINDLDYLMEVVVRWEGVFDDDGVEVEFSKDAFGGFINDYQTSPTEIFEAYIKGLTESRAKN